MKLINRAPPLRSNIFSSLHFLRLFKDLKIPGEGRGGVAEGKGEGKKVQPPFYWRRNGYDFRS